MPLHWPSAQGPTEKCTKNRITICTVLEVEIGPKVTTLGRRRTVVVAKFDLGGGDMKVATINISSAKLHNMEHLHPDTDGNGEERAAADTKKTTGDTTITDSVLIRVFEAPAPDPLNDEALSVVIIQTMTKKDRPTAISIGRGW